MPPDDIDEELTIYGNQSNQGRDGPSDTMVRWISEKNNAKLIGDVLKDIALLALAAAGVFAAAQAYPLAALSLLAAALNLAAGDVWHWIANDPPQLRYKREASVVLTPLPDFQVQASEPGELAELARDLLAWGIALLDSMERSQGAALAGDDAWEKIHVVNFQRDWTGLKARLAKGEEALAASIQWLGNKAAGEPPPVPPMPKQREKVTAALTGFGFNDAMLGRFWDIVDRMPAPRRTAAELVTALDDILRRM